MSYLGLPNLLVLGEHTLVVSSMVTGTMFIPTGLEFRGLTRFTANLPFAANQVVSYFRKKELPLDSLAPTHRV